MTGAQETCSADKLIVCNVLCYASTARHVMKSDEIKYVCIAFYSSDDIIRAKDLLYNILNVKSIRRKGTDRILKELNDIMELLSDSDDNDKVLPKFVVDTYNGLPPISGFELVANSINSLMEELSKLTNEISVLKKERINETIFKNDYVIMKEDILTIKGELRKLNHSILKEDIRRNSFILDTLDKSLNDLTSPDKNPSVIEKNTDVQLQGSSRIVADINNEVISILPSAPRFFNCLLRS